MMFLFKEVIFKFYVDWVGLLLEIQHGYQELIFGNSISFPLALNFRDEKDLFLLELLECSLC